MTNSCITPGNSQGLTFVLPLYIREQHVKDVCTVCGSDWGTCCVSPARCDLGEGGFAVRCGRSLGSGLCSPRTPSHGSYHRGLHGGVCAQEPELVVKKERGLGKGIVFFQLYVSECCWWSTSSGFISSVVNWRSCRCKINIFDHIAWILIIFDYLSLQCLIIWKPRADFSQMIMDNYKRECNFTTIVLVKILFFNAL